MKKQIIKEIYGSPGTSEGDPRGADIRIAWGFIAKQGKTKNSRSMAKYMLKKFLR